MVCGLSYCSMLKLWLMVNKKIKVKDDYLIHGGRCAILEGHHLSWIAPLCVHHQFLSFNFQVYCQFSFASCCFFCLILQREPERCLLLVHHARGSNGRHAKLLRGILFDFGRSCVLADEEKITAILDSDIQGKSSCSICLI